MTLITDRAAARALVRWFDSHGRRLAFRTNRDPYAVLVSETMLQQTQVARIETAWPAFMGAFPTLQVLARAPTGDVIRAWAGLGYNRRAVYLQRAAQAVVTDHHGAIPDDPVLLERLPGVGPYTARAVAALAYGRPVAAVDTNVRRVVGRFVAGHGHRTDPGSGLPAGELQAAADRLIDRAAPAAWTHAAMDLASAVCTIRAPACARCPLHRGCAYVAHSGTTVQQSAVAPARRAATPATRPFPTTRRWLRGRLVGALRAADGDGWVSFAEPIGDHDREAIEVTLADLQAEGLLVRDAAGRARLPG